MPEESEVLSMLKSTVADMHGNPPVELVQHKLPAMLATGGSVCFQAERDHVIGPKFWSTACDWPIRKIDDSQPIYTCRRFLANMVQ